MAEYHATDTYPNRFAIRPEHLVPAAAALAAHLGTPAPAPTRAASIAALIDGLDRAGIIEKTAWSDCLPDRGLRTSYYRCGGDMDELKAIMTALAPFLDASTELEYEHIIAPGVYELGYMSVHDGAVSFEDAD